jgi:hypothetical protein
MVVGPRSSGCLRALLGPSPYPLPVNGERESGTAWSEMSVIVQGGGGGERGALGGPVHAAGAFRFPLPASGERERLRSPDEIQMR